MPTESNSIIAQEIDDIIARAMAEYASSHPDAVIAAVDVAASTSDDRTEATTYQHPETVAYQQLPTPQDEPVSLAGEEESAEEEAEEVHQEIPVNSSSLLVSETTSRFSSAIWYDNIQQKQVTIAGLGGIGSYVAFLIARMNPNGIYLYDFDTVEAANMSGQLYGCNHIGMNKAQAIAQVMREYASYYNVCCCEAPFDSSSAVTPVMICGFDNMNARKEFFNAWKRVVRNIPKENRGNYILIDGRLAAESFQVFCIKGDDDYNIRRYESEFLFSDEEAEETVCSYKQTTFMANMIGSVMTNLFVNFCANQCEPLIDRDLPFYTEYNAETMYFKVQS